MSFKPSNGPTEAPDAKYSLSSSDAKSDRGRLLDPGRLMPASLVNRAAGGKLGCIDE